MNQAKLHFTLFFGVLVSIAFLTGTVFSKDAPENKKLGPEFLKDVIALQSKKEVPALAKKYNFIQVTDEDDLNILENEKVKGTIEVLAVDGLYISLGYSTYEKACAASEAMIKANLETPKTFKYKPYWPEQVFITSRWTGQGKQSHVSLSCEQFGEDGSSNVDININFTKL